MTKPKERATKNLDIEVERFLKFVTDVISPVTAAILLEGKGVQAPQVTITVRRISDVYGYSAARAFELMFMQRVRGGRSTTTGEVFKSAWEPNTNGLYEYLVWNRDTKEKTARSLFKHLEAAGVRRMRYNKNTQTYIDVDTDFDDRVNYSAILTMLKENPEAIEMKGPI